VCHVKVRQIGFSRRPEGFSAIHVCTFRMINLIISYNHNQHFKFGFKTRQKLTFFTLLKLMVAVLLVLQCIIYRCPEVNLNSSWLLNMVDYFFLNLRLVRKYPSVVTGLSVTGRPRPHLQTKPIFNLFSQGF